MSREHLYKAKRVNWKELPKEEWWVEGYYVKHGSRHWIYTGEIQYMYYPVCADLPTKYEVEEETVCEYTGLIGRNRKKIFEGNIVKTDFYKQFYGYEKPDKSDLDIYEVYFNGITYCVKNNERECALSNGSKGCEVIGNIYDNIELLEGGEAE